MLRLAVRSSRNFLTQIQRSYSAANPQELALKSSNGSRITSTEFLQKVKEQTEGANEVSIEEFQPPRSAFDVLAAEYDALREECDDVTDKYKRALAETENVRRRGQKQVDDAKVFAIQSFCKDLLEVADVLNLALESVKSEDLEKDSNLKNLYDGVNMTSTVLQKTFARHGLKKVSPEGEKFDPNLHDAVFQVPKEATKHAPGHVAEVMKIGYYLHDRPIRAAQVGVVKH
ncbi:unnamed protein product [Bursaphelenchus okinawaensis]|uniref:GrpE protein homolog n=1 Tax=Bursaphelenchus okinawaensis TaxID=465554 RepID=A0A811KF57_9BILA|nr:unnamed protein product [Bursaphelenchus okinawaensis]CAG9103443.1 unnamed protein product [Bursaphelenchus okinawaensis]